MNGPSEKSIKITQSIAVVLLALLTAWLAYLLFAGHEPDSPQGQIWASLYQILAWFGAICGLFFSRLWGGWKSQVGRATIAFSIGLLAQSFGQSVFSYYYYIGVEAPYPSIADIGFFGSIPIYIYAIYVLGRASGAKLSLKAFQGKAIAFLIPIVILGLSYYYFLLDYQVDWSAPLVVLLDFGYPLGQAIYISLAIVAYLLTRNYLGGLMKTPVLLLIIALFIQFVADYSFLYQISREIYVGGYEIDYLYLLAYFMMAYSLIRMGGTYYKIKNS